jgi:putative transposase
MGIIAQLIKGESSFWFNHQKDMGKHKLYWQDQYFAVSVSPSMLGKTRAYIDNQEAHHQKRTFAKEYGLFLKKFEMLSILDNEDSNSKINSNSKIIDGC